MYTKSRHGSNTETKKVIVIGAGIGGLAAACLMASMGHEVKILERNSGVGGKLNQLKIKEYRFDTGPSLLTMPFVLEQLFAFCGKNLSDYLELQPLHPICRYFYQNGQRFDAFDDLHQTTEEIKRFSEKDAAQYPKFLKYSGKLYDRTTDTFLMHPLQKWKDILQMPLSDALRIDAFTTVSRRVDQYFESEEMRMFFKRFTTYNGSSPYRAPATLNVIPYVELVKGGYYVKGGLFRISEALLSLAKELGVELKTNISVEKISVVNGEVTGVSTSGGHFKADIVVSNSDAFETYTNLLSEEVVTKSKLHRVKSTEPSCSGFVLLLGTTRKWSQLKHHSIFFSSDYRNEFDEIFDAGKLPSDPTIYIANTSYSDENHAPKGGSNLFILVNAPYLREGQRLENTYESYANFLIKKLEKRGLSGLQESIEVRDMISPTDFYTKYLSNKGSIYGTSSNSRFSAFLRPRNRDSKIKNLWLVGGSTHPGGGIPLCVISAFHACGVKVHDAEFASEKA